MKHSRKLGILALCSVAAFSAGVVASCDDDSVTAPSGEALLGEACSVEKPCVADLECSAEGVCVEVEEPPVDEPDEPQPPVEEDPCADIVCTGDKVCLNALCLDPECIVDGAEKDCGEGKMCSKGECIDDGCEGVLCEEGEVCSKGLCEDALCVQNSVVCSAGSTCVKGECIDNACIGQVCDEGLTCSKGECMYPACVGKDACGLGKSCNADGNCVFEVEPALNASIDKQEIDETGASATVTLSLNNPPSSEVTVNCVLSPESAALEAEVDCSNIRFAADNYAAEQTVHVIGLPDNVLDEDQKVTLTLTTVSEDPEFVGLEKSFEITNKNIDKVGVTVVGANLQTSESGGSAVLSVVLNAKPESDVTFEVSSSNEAYGKIEGAVENKLTVTFTSENWNIPQELKVVGVDDGPSQNLEEHKYQVIFSKTSSEDVNFKDLDIAAVDVLNIDNDIAEIFIDKTEIETIEMDEAVSVNVRLGLEPKSPVNMTLKAFKTQDASGEESAEVTFSEMSFTLDKDNYLEGKTITVQSIDDNRIDGDQAYYVLLHASSEDASYENVDKWIVGKSIDKNVAGFQFNVAGTTVSEDEIPMEIGLALTAMPEAEVVVAIDSDNTSEMEVSPRSMTFTPENWNQEQKITVLGIDDLVVDGDTISNILLSSTSEDSNFNLSDKVEITTLDNDKAEIVVTAKGIEIPENTHETIKFDVVLSSQPQAQVRVKLKSSDESELKIYGQSTLIFTSDNWNHPQTVMLQVVDDNFADGTQFVHLDLTSSSDDKNYKGLTAVTPDYSILDNESAAVVLTAAKTVFKPGDDAQTTMTVRLSALPGGNVPVKLSTTNDKAVQLSQTDFVFTTENWNQPQELTITTDVNAVASAKAIETISALASGTGSYQGLKSNNVAMTLYYFMGSKDFDFTGEPQEITLLPGRYKFQVWGASGGDGVSYNQIYSSHAGLGGYSEGVINLKEKTTTYVLVGGVGRRATRNCNPSQCHSLSYACTRDVPDSGGYNGGGWTADTNYDAGGGGGGTDIRLGTNSLYARVIVAGGGGGGDNSHGTTGTGGNDDGSGGYGGGAAAGKYYVNGVAQGNVATQTSGYKFGEGASPTLCWDIPGGGGGWFGGYTSEHNNGGGGGGSGFVWMGTPDVSEAVIGGKWLLTDSQKLESGRTVAGNQSFPATGSGSEIGHKGNGYARITLVE